VPKLIVLILAYAALAIADDCPSGWVRYSNKCYLFTTSHVLYAQCNTDCSTYQSRATMLCIESTDQNSFVQSSLQSIDSGSQSSFFIGYQRDLSGEFVWFTGCESSFTNWDYNEPNNFQNTLESYVEIYAHGRWNDIFDETRPKCACELSVQSNQLPSGQPSSQPSEQPSGQPSGHPSELPSDQPSDQPSKQPSGQPSCQPTEQPSGLPTKPVAPSAKPTPVPIEPPTTAEPTAVPSPRVETTLMRARVPPITELYDRAGYPATGRRHSAGARRYDQSGDQVKSKINKLREKVAAMRGEL
jgi:hypothetical protein